MAKKIRKGKQSSVPGIGSFLTELTSDLFNNLEFTVPFFFLTIILIVVGFDSLNTMFKIPAAEPIRGDIRPSSPPDGEKCSEVEFIPREAEGTFRFAVYPNANKDGDFHKTLSLYDHRRSTWFQTLKDVKVCMKNTENGLGWGVEADYALSSISSSDVLGVTRTEKGRMCGFVSISVRSYADKKEKRLSVADLHVVCATYKQGSNLINKSIEYLRDQKFDIVTLEATTENLVKFYQKFGFKVGWGGEESKDTKRKVLERMNPDSIELWKLNEEDIQMCATKDKEPFRNKNYLIPMSLCLKKNTTKKTEINRSA